MKKLFAVIAAGLALLALPVAAQTTNSPPASTNIFTILQSSNIFVIPYANYSIKSHDVGAGVGIGYKVTDFAAVIMRLDDWKGDLYTASFGAALQPPQYWLGKVPVTPVAYTGVETPLKGDATTDAFVGAGGYVNFSFLGDNFFTRHVELIATYEVHMGLPEAEKRQLKIGPIFKISF